MRIARARALTLLSFAAASVISCDGSHATSPVDALVLAQQPAYIMGPVTWRDSTTLSVERAEGEGYERATVHILRGSAFMFSDGTVATADDIEVGAVVSVWTTGFEYRSSPPQVNAKLVAIAR